ncbi:MAG: hypothetical protein HYV13_03165 [Candidatus Doudnabacteria bacterium]|nr:hypothetical protein [Candidatus Doudnabacteria bacterium]
MPEIIGSAEAASLTTIGALLFIRFVFVGLCHVEDKARSFSRRVYGQEEASEIPASVTAPAGKIVSFPAIAAPAPISREREKQPPIAA